MPNPFYQVYAVAALTVGAEPVYVPATAATGFLPDYASLPHDMLDRTAIAYHLLARRTRRARWPRADYLADLLALAEKHDFQVFADECYSEIWRDTPPPGILAVADTTGADPERAVAFHSLSKRSNLPGLRSGFVAAGPQSMTHIRQLRAFAGAPLPLPMQKVSEAAWDDEAHVDRLARAVSAEIRRCRRHLCGHAGLSAPRRRLFPVASGRGRRSGGAETLARNRRAGSARRLSVARCRGRQPRQRLYPGGPCGAPAEKRSAG